MLIFQPQSQASKVLKHFILTFQEENIRITRIVINNDKNIPLTCDRTTSKMRDLSPKIISGDSRQSENAQTHTYKHTVSYMKFKLKLLQIKCHVLKFTKDEDQKMLQKIIRVFAEAFVSYDRYTLFALEDSGLPRMTYTCES
jgi:hypothetical protein